jgi:hypothetical protein
MAPSRQAAASSALAQQPQPQVWHGNDGVIEPNRLGAALIVVNPARVEV